MFRGPTCQRWWHRAGAALAGPRAAAPPPRTRVRSGGERAAECWPAGLGRPPCRGSASPEGTPLLSGRKDSSPGGATTRVLRTRPAEMRSTFSSRPVYRDFRETPAEVWLVTPVGGQGAQVGPCSFLDGGGSKRAPGILYVPAQTQHRSSYLEPMHRVGPATPRAAQMVKVEGYRA